MIYIEYSYVLKIMYTNLISIGHYSNVKKYEEQRNWSVTLHMLEIPII